MSADLWDTINLCKYHVRICILPTAFIILYHWTQKKFRGLHTKYNGDHGHYLRRLISFLAKFKASK